MNKEILLRPAQRSTIVGSIIEQLVEQIRNKALQPGDRLPSEHQLMQMLGVSRPSVREAIQALVAMGLVESRRGSGIFVRIPKASDNFNLSTSSSPHSLEMELRYQLSSARFILETGIINEACAHITPEGASLISEALNEYYPSDITYPTDLKWETHDRIHLCIAQATGNRILVQMLKTLLDMVPKSLREAGVFSGTSVEIQEHFKVDMQIHSELCKAIIQGDWATAHEWLKRHRMMEEMSINHYYEHEMISRKENPIEKKG